MKNLVKGFKSAEERSHFFAQLLASTPLLEIESYF